MIESSIFTSSSFRIPEGDIEAYKGRRKTTQLLWLEALFNKELSLEELKKFPEDQIRLACGFVKALCRDEDKADQRYVGKFFEMAELILSNPSSISQSST